jgi:hypothetical protein
MEMKMFDFFFVQVYLNSKYLFYYLLNLNINKPNYLTFMTIIHLTIDFSRLTNTELLRFEQLLLKLLFFTIEIRRNPIQF